MIVPAMAAIKPDCRFFRGDIPCRPHKEHGVHCTERDGSPCPYYKPTTSNILIIKLGAMGDVLRTTPLLHRIWADHPQARIWWLTHWPEMVPSSVDVILPFTAQSLATLQSVAFDLLVNLDKDLEACALAATLQSRITKGFTLVNGRPAPADTDAQAKFATGLFDDLSKANRKSYQQEIFEICGFSFAGERYILDPRGGQGPRWKLPAGKPVVGLNTGCGGRWTSRLWPERSWVTLARQLKKSGYTPLLLGGEQEDAKNKRIARISGALYLGHVPLARFINLVQHCDMVVTGVTMAMHLTIGLGKRIVLFNNIFNRHEFDLYGLGEILEPDPPCRCYYAPQCTDPARLPDGCMSSLTVERVYAACTRLLPPPVRSRPKGTTRR